MAPPKTITVDAAREGNNDRPCRSRFRKNCVIIVDGDDDNDDVVASDLVVLWLLEKTRRDNKRLCLLEDIAILEIIMLVLPSIVVAGAMVLVSLSQQSEYNRSSKAKIVVYYD